MHNSCFIISLLYASTCFEHYVLIIRKSKLYYTASGIVTPVGGRPVHRLRDYTEMHGQQNINFTDTCNARYIEYDRM